MASTVVDGVTAAARAEPGARRTSLRKIADVFAGGGRDIAVGVVTKAIEHKYGVG
jgi:hypothetical protein